MRNVSPCTACPPSHIDIKPLLEVVHQRDPFLVVLVVAQDAADYIGTLLKITLLARTTCGPRGGAEIITASGKSHHGVDVAIVGGARSTELGGRLMPITEA